MASEDHPITPGHELSLYAFLTECMAALGDYSGHMVVRIKAFVADLAFGKVQFEPTLIH